MWGTVPTKIRNDNDNLEMERPHGENKGERKGQIRNIYTGGGVGDNV
jgi:hypothetical protein